MPRFADFKSAGRTNPIAQAQLAEQRRQFNKGRQDEHVGYAADAYGKWAGDRTPIRDGLKWGGDKIADALRKGNIEAPMDYSDAGPSSGMIEPPMPSGPSGMIEPPMPAVAPPAIPDQLNNYADVGIRDAILGAEATDVVADEAGAASGIPLVSALRGGKQLIDGDVEGALGTGTKAALATLGPAGIAAGFGLGLLGV